MLIIQLSQINLNERRIKSLSGYEEIYRGIQDESVSYIVWITIAVKKGFSNLRIKEWTGPAYRDIYATY